MLVKLTVRIVRCVSPGGRVVDTAGGGRSILCCSVESLSNVFFPMFGGMARRLVRVWSECTEEARWVYREASTKRMRV